MPAPKIDFGLDDLYGLLQRRVERLRQQQDVTGLGPAQQGEMGPKLRGLRQAALRWGQNIPRQGGRYDRKP